MRKQIVTLLTGAMLMVASSAMALTINYNTPMPGQATPSGPSPWLVATLTDGNQMIGTTSISGVFLNVEAKGLVGSEFTTDMVFNTTLSSLAGLTLFNVDTSIATIKNNSFSVGIDAQNQAPGGQNNLFDIAFSFETSGSGGGAGRLVDGEIAKLFFYGASGLSADTFEALSFGEKGGYISVAHIQGMTVPTGAADSTWVTEGNTPVPEPGTMMLFGVGMFGLAVFGKRRMNKVS